MKILCGAAAKGASFERCLSIGRAVNDEVVSIGSSLDHCHVPGREGHKPIPSDVCVVGAGIHNEPVGVTGWSRLRRDTYADLLLRVLYKYPLFPPLKS